MVWWVWQHKEIVDHFSFPDWLLVFVCLSIPIGFSLVPNTLVGLLAGYFLGFYGLAGMVVSFSLASVIGYFVGQKVDSGLREAIFQIWPKARFMVQKLESQSVFVVVLFRLSPAPPFAVGSLLLSWFKVRFKSFIAGGLLGMLPRMAVVVWVGSQAGNVAMLLKNPGESPQLRLFSGALVFLVAIGVFWLRQRLKNNS